MNKTRGTLLHYVRYTFLVRAQKNNWLCCHLIIRTCFLHPLINTHQSVKKFSAEFYQKGRKFHKGFIFKILQNRFPPTLPKIIVPRTEPMKQPRAGRVGIANIYNKILATYCQTAQCDICRLQIDRHCYAYSGLSRKLLIGIWFTWKTNNCFKKYLSIYSITSNYSYVTLVLTKTNFAILWLTQFFLVVLVVKTTKRFLSLTVLRPILSDFFRKFMK